MKIIYPKTILLGLIIFFTISLVVFGPIFNNKTETKTVHMFKYQYSPQNIELNKGDFIIFENNDTGSHWPASNIHPTHELYPEFDPKKPVEPSKSWKFEFNNAGTWQYHDHLNPQISGIITVKQKKDPSVVSLISNFLIQKLIFLKNKPLESEKTYNSSIAENSEKIFTDDNALYSYVKKYGPQKAVQVLNSGQNKYGDCHQRAHKLGQDAYEVYGDQAFQKCSAECHSGCYHGATEAYFRKNGTDNLVNNLQTLCGSQLNDFFTHQCMHGVGHGLMAWSNYELNSALAYCEKLPSDSAKSSCWSGVFMENIVGALAENEVSKKTNLPKDTHFTKYLSDDPHFPCNAVDEKYVDMCYFYQTTRMTQLFNYDFKKVAQQCSLIKPSHRLFCFESLGRDIGGKYQNSPENAIKNCNVVTDPVNKSYCLDGALQNYFWDPSGQDYAITFCKDLDDEAQKDMCFRSIINRSKSVLSKSQLPGFCNKLSMKYSIDCFSDNSN